MKKILMKAVSLCVMIALLAIPVAATEHSSVSTDPRASLQLAQYGISLANASRGTMRATFTVYGTQSKMITIGAKAVVIEQEVGSGKWQEVCSFHDYYGSDCSFYMDAVTFSVQTGVNYRATLTAYAKDANGSDSRDVTSGTLRASA